MQRKLADMTSQLNAGQLVDGALVDLSHVKPAKQLKASDGKQIAALLLHPNCPNNMTLNLTKNDLTDKGAKEIKTALASGKCKAGLTITLDGNDISKKLMSEIADLVSANNKRHQEKRDAVIYSAAYACLQFRKGVVLPKDVVAHICSFVYPDQNKRDSNGFFTRQRFGNTVNQFNFLSNKQEATMQESAEAALAIV